MSKPDPAPATSTSCPSCGTQNRPGARFCRSCGTLLALPAPAEAGPPPPVPAAAESAPDSPTQRRRLRRRLLIGGGLVLVLLVGYGVVAAIQDTFYTPVGPVKELFAALAGRDGAHAGELVGCSSSPVCQAPALASGYEPPRNLSIVSVRYGATVDGDLTRRPNKNRAYVVVRYQLAGSTHEDSVGLERPSSGLFRPWHITRAPGGDLDIVSTTVETARLGGAQISTEAPASYPRRGATVHPLPGIYTLAAVETPLVGAVPATVVIAGDVDRQQLTLDVTVKTGVVDEVNKQVRARIDACAAQATLSPDVGHGMLRNCPFEYLGDYALARRNVKWNVVAYPRIELRKNDDGSVEVHTTTAGAAKVTYEHTLDVVEPRQWTTAEGTSEITVTGGVDVEDGKIVWTG